MITSAGFIKKTQSEILEELENEARVQFGDDVDLSVYGEVGQFVQLMSQALSDTWDGLEDVYYSAFIDTSEGVSLDRVVALGGISRRAAQQAFGTLSVSGVDGTTITSLSLTAQTSQAIQFQNITSGVVTGGTTTLTIQAIEGGEEGIVPADSIIELTNPFTGVDAITNPLATTGGAEIESDPNLRARYKEVSITGGSSVPAIISALKNLDNVDRAIVIENATNATDGEGRPPHSVECVVGGTATDVEIATAIFNSKAAGIEPYGSESYTVFDENGDAHTIKWNVPTQKLVNVKVEITSNAEWVTANEEVVIERVIEVIGGVYTDAESNTTEYSGLDIGDDVYSWAIEANMQNITGVEDLICYVAFSPTTPTTLRKLTIGDNEYARLDNAQVTVVVS